MRVNIRYVTPPKVHPQTGSPCHDVFRALINRPCLWILQKHSRSHSVSDCNTDYRTHCMETKAMKTFLLLYPWLVQILCHMLCLQQAVCSSGQRACKCANNPTDRAGWLRRDPFYACLAKLSMNDSSAAECHVVFYLT